MMNLENTLTARFAKELNKIKTIDEIAKSGLFYYWSSWATPAEDENGLGDYVGYGETKDGENMTVVFTYEADGTIVDWNFC